MENVTIDQLKLVSDEKSEVGLFFKVYSSLFCLFHLYISQVKGCSVHLFPDYCSVASSHQMGKLPLRLFFTALLIEFIPKTSVSQKAVYQRQPEAHGGFGKKLKKSKKLLTGSVVTAFGALSKGPKLLRRNKVMLWTKFHLVAMKTHWNIPQIILKFAQSNTLHGEWQSYGK